jgi:photosystem II stability/assembly factor-like uncharacterized protein
MRGKRTSSRARLLAAASVTTLLFSLGGCARRAKQAAPPAASRSGGWEEVRIGTDAVFNGLHFVDAETGWVVGGSPFVSGGVAGRTEDGGTTWTFVTGITKGGPTSDLSAVHGFDRQRACAVGDGTFVTLDGGLSWQRSRAVRKAAARLWALDFLDDNEGWAAGAGGVLHTSDGGMNWTEVGGEDSPARRVNGRVLHFTDARNGWLGGQYGALYRTRDGGATWARVPVPAPVHVAHPPTLFGGTWPDASRGWIVGEYGTILRTADAGDSWELVDAGTREAFFTAVSFAGADGWITGFLPDRARSVVYRSKDGGATWFLERTLDGEELRALQVLDAHTGWAVGDRVRTEPQRLLRRARRPRTP